MVALMRSPNVIVMQCTGIGGVVTLQHIHAGKCRGMQLPHLPVRYQSRRSRRHAVDVELAAVLGHGVGDDNDARRLARRKVAACHAHDCVVV